MVTNKHLAAQAERTNQALNIEAANAAFKEAYERWSATFKVVKGTTVTGRFPAPWEYNARELAWQVYLNARDNWIRAHAGK